MAAPEGLLEVNIAIGVVSEVMPYEVVVEVLRGNAMEAHHEGLQLAVIAIDSLNTKCAVHAAVGFQLQKVQVLAFREAYIATQLVSAEDRIRCNPAAQYAAQRGNGRTTKVCNLGDRFAVTIDSAWYTDLFQRDTALLGSLAAHMRFSRHGKAFAVTMVALERDAEERFIGFYDAVQLDLVLHFLQGVKDLVAEEESRIFGNLALHGTRTDCHPVHHAMDIVQEGV